MAYEDFFEDIDFNQGGDYADFFGDQTSWWDNLFPPSGDGFWGGLSSLPWGNMLGMGIGGLLGSYDGSKQAGVTTTTSGPWVGQQPYLQDLFAKAASANAASQYPSLDELLSYTQGMGLSSGGAKQIADTFSGAYMTPDNPLYKSILDDATSQVGSRFYGRDQTGPVGSRSGFGDTFAKTLGDRLSSNLFNPERQRQVAYATMFNPASGQASAQGMRMDPFRSLQNYGSLIGGQYGSVQTQPYYTNPYAGGLGGALMGGQIWNNLFK